MAFVAVSPTSDSASTSGMSTKASTRKYGSSLETCQHVAAAGSLYCWCCCAVLLRLYFLGFGFEFRV